MTNKMCAHIVRPHMRRRWARSLAHLFSKYRKRGCGGASAREIHTLLCLEICVIHTLIAATRILVVLWFVHTIHSLECVLLLFRIEWGTSSTLHSRQSSCRCWRRRRCEFMLNHSELPRRVYKLLHVHTTITIYGTRRARQDFDRAW